MRIQMKARAAILAAAVIGTGLLGALPANASSAYHPIYNYGSNLCLGVVASSHNAGQYNCTGNADQQWTVINEGAMYEIKNENGDCLYVSGNSQQNGAQLKASSSDCTGTWQLGQWTYPGASGAWTLNAYYTNSPLVAGINAGSLKSGAEAVLWQHLSPARTNQYWYSPGNW
jgi:hypothetical protein